jgi:hypothetical protein
VPGVYLSTDAAGSIQSQISSVAVGSNTVPGMGILRHPGASTRDGNLVPSGYVKIAIENGHRNSEFSHQKWWIFP